jgi:predicted CxxxxCH...CXXCH cytochrome family protein
MRTKAIAIIIVGFVVSFACCFIAFAANDTPHNASNNMSCGSCHGETLLDSPFWGGSWTYDQLCLSCHTETSPGQGGYTDKNAPFEKTHSSQTTSTKYGTWTRECRNCHNPHYQRQKVYKNTDASNLYLATGKIQSCEYTGIDPDSKKDISTFTFSTITYKTGTGWNATRLPKKTGDYRGAILFPNVGKLGYNYPITAVNPGANTITVNGNLTTECSNNYFNSTTFAVIYGQYIKDILDISPDGSGNNKTVKLFDQVGPKSFADGYITYDGVCEVCHTKTDHYRNADYAGSAPDQHHLNIGGADATNCISCHSHTEGFKPSCNICHGYPPPPLASIPKATGSATAGAHVFHVTTMSYQCSICHYNSVGSGTFHNDNKITLGFVGLLGSYTGGSYDGQGALINNFDYESSDPGTTVSKTGLKKCSNLYCHGGTMAPDGGTATAIWDNPSSAACGTCHGATVGVPPTRGSHTKHAGERQLACTVCHSSYTHISGSVDWAYDTATYTWLSGALYRGVASGSATPVPSAGYGQCSNLYCHSIAQTSTGGALTPDTSDYKTPTWGQTFSGVCGGGACHAVGNAHPSSSGFTALASGSHGKHLVYMFDQIGNCQSCHFDYSYNICDNCHTRTVNHVDHSVDIVFNPEFPMVASSTSGTYSGDSVPGNGFGSCSSLYCHSPGTKADAPYDSPNTTNITWGTTPLPSDCTGCHNGDNNTTNKMSTGSHLKHILSYDCSLCHKYTVSNSRTLNPQIYTGNLTYGHRYHVNGWVTIVFDSTVAVNGTYAGQTSPINYRGPGSAYGSCTNIICHNDGTAVWTGGTGVGNTPTWGTAGGCNSCHGNTTYTDYRKGTPLYASYPSGTKPNAHQLHTDARTPPSGEPQCNNCHSSVTSSNTAIDGTTPSDHMNNIYNIVAGNTYKDGDNVGSAAVSVTITYSYSGTPNTSTCSNVSCHPTGLGGTYHSTSTTWDNAYKCTDCHNINMNNTSGYHHAMDANAMADRTYPTSAPSSATDSNRKCTMCHVDHNIFSPMLNVNNTNGRSYNLRTNISTPPTASSGYTNSDYASGGGICISCHTMELSKTGTQKTETSSMVTMAVTDANFSASAHKYNVDSTMANDPLTLKFYSNCSKCHNAKNGESTTFQSSTNKFGVHDSTARRLVTALGGTLTENYEEAFCYRCHSKVSDGIGGTKKSADANDWYGAVTNMSAPSTSMYQVFQKTYKHNVAGYSGLHKPSPTDEIRTYLSANKHVECDDCHNPHAAKAGLHSSNQVHVAASTNLIAGSGLLPASGPLTGAQGAEPTWSSSNWGGASWPTTTTSTATKEYQICFKCHASYNTDPSGWNSANIDWTDTTGPTAWTDVALEFNPSNGSYHPVVQALPETDPGSNGSNRLPPSHISLVIGDSGRGTSSDLNYIADSNKNWATDQWVNWGLRIGKLGSCTTGWSTDTTYNAIRRITSNDSTTLGVGTDFFAEKPKCVVYSIEYYAGRGTKGGIDGKTVTDTTKDFTLYLPSLVGYVVVISDNLGNNIAKGTVTYNTATSFTVNAWTALYGSEPDNGTVGYFFSATGHAMMCSECHSNDTISSTAAQGPHGSAVKWMLKGRNRAWPSTSASENGTGTGTLFKIGVSSSYPGRTLNDGTPDGLFCLNCHSTVSFSKDAKCRENFGSTGVGNPHQIHSWWAGPACVNCHIMVPHGGKISRLIGDGNSNMPARYAFNNDLSNMWIMSFSKATDPASYSNDYCYSTYSGCSPHPHGNSSYGGEDW